jgi:hypothetical protein
MRNLTFGIDLHFPVRGGDTNLRGRAPERAEPFLRAGRGAPPACRAVPDIAAGPRQPGAGYATQCGTLRDYYSTMVGFFFC